jgi:hypothetical protein
MMMRPFIDLAAVEHPASRRYLLATISKRWEV